MIHLENGKETYDVFMNAIQEVEDSIGYLKDATKKLCLDAPKEDNSLGEFVTFVSGLRASVRDFNQIFEDFMMEIQEAERIIWEEEQSKIEGEYYGEGHTIIKE